MIKSRKSVIALILVVFIIIGSVLVVSTQSTESEALEVIYEEKNPLFQYFREYNGQNELLTNGSSGWYEQKSSLTQYSAETDSYAIETNSFVMWMAEDHVAYAFNNYSLAHGDQSKITAYAKILSHTTTDPDKKDKMHENASIGICMRNADAVDSKEIYLHLRRERALIVYRTQDGAETKYPGDSARIPITKYPVELKMERSGNAIRCSIRCADQKNWSAFATQYINLGDKVTVGMAAHSSDRNVPITSTFNDYSVTIEGPEGSKYVAPGEEEEADKVENPLPADPPVTEEEAKSLLFRETFTDGSLINPSDDGKNHVDNPIWTNTFAIEGNIENAVIENDGENAYWKRNFSNDSYFFSNNEWYDYSYTVNVRFGMETTSDGDNKLDLYSRIHTSRDTGFYGYRFAFQYGNKIIVYKLAGRKNPQSTEWKATEVNYNYIDFEQIKKDKESGIKEEDRPWDTYKIVSFDNKITLYRVRDGVDEEIVSFTDEGTLGGSNAYGANTYGGIGIGSDGADLYVDNMVVRKMTDLKGGNYDNLIGGNYDSPMPDYIKNYKYETNDKYKAE